MLDYDTLKILWWAFVGLLLIGFMLTDGFDFGIAMMLPFVGKTDLERRVMINSIGSTWEASQTWFITAGGAVFAAWPLVYGTAFSGFYVVFMVLLFSLFLRPAGFVYRSKLDHARWRSVWDGALFISGWVPPLIFGVAFGNLFLGVPFYFDETMRVHYLGGFWALLNPFGLLAGALSISMCLMHGAAFVHVKTGDPTAERARMVAPVAATLTIALFILGGCWIAFGLDGYVISVMPDPQSAFMPSAKTVVIAEGAWMNNYARWSFAWMIPSVAIAAALLCAVLSRLGHALSAFIASGVSVASIVATAGMSLFPFIMPSSHTANDSLTIWDAVSSHKTLGLMFWVVVIMMPIIMVYTTWAYRIMRGKVTREQILADEHTAY